MNQTEANKALYEKMFAEFKRYQKSLLDDTPEAILENAYEYTVKEDILYYLEENEIEKYQAEALLKSDTPLEDCYQKWMHSDSDYMYEIGRVIRREAEDKADEHQKQREQKAKGDSR